MEIWHYLPSCSNVNAWFLNRMFIIVIFFNFTEYSLLLYQPKLRNTRHCLILNKYIVIMLNTRDIRFRSTLRDMRRRDNY